MITHALEELNLNRMELQVYSNNPRAQKCYRNVRFKEEVRMKEVIYVHGQIS